MASSGIPGMPVAVPGLVCPRCKLIPRNFYALDGQTLVRCSGCEWYFTLGTQAPTGTSNGAITAGVTTAIPVASGGASFTLGMILFADAGTLTEVLIVQSGGSGTSVPVAQYTWESGSVGSVAGFSKSHLTAMAFGQLALTPTVATVDHVTPVGGWGF